MKLFKLSIYQNLQMLKMEKNDSEPLLFNLSQIIMAKSIQEILVGEGDFRQA